MCFGCSKSPFDRDASFEYLQHMFLLRNKINNFQFRTLILGLGSEKYYTFDVQTINGMRHFIISLSHMSKMLSDYTASN